MSCEREFKVKHARTMHISHTFKQAVPLYHTLRPLRSCLCVAVPDGGPHTDRRLMCSLLHISIYCIVFDPRNVKHSIPRARHASRLVPSRTDSARKTAFLPLVGAQSARFEV